MKNKMLKLLVIGLGLMSIFFLVAIFLNRGLPDYVRYTYDSHKKFLLEDIEQLQKNIAMAQNAVATEKNYLEPIALRDKWSDKFSTIQERINNVQKLIEEGDKLIKKNERNDFLRMNEINSAFAKERTSAPALKNAADPIVSAVNRLLGYKKNFTQISDTTKANTDYIIQFPQLNTLDTALIQAKADWPKKKEDLNKRRAVFAEYKKQAETLYRNFLIEKNKISVQSKDANYEKFGILAEDLTKIKTSYDAAYKNLESLAQQLYYSFDKILEDIDSKYTAGSYHYYHTYKIVKIDMNKKHSELKETVEVTKPDYDKNSKNLGMVIDSKELGLYDHEAAKFASPPGYRYVGDKKYGEWKRDAHGNSFWAFYGQYAFMRSLFWGPSYYQPIFRRDYDTYSNYRKNGQTYYGRTSTGSNQYGTSGTYTRTKYSGSKYMSKSYSRSTSRSTSRSYRGYSSSGTRYGGSRGK